MEEMAWDRRAKVSQPLSLIWKPPPPPQRKERKKRGKKYLIWPAFQKIAWFALICKDLTKTLFCRGAFSSLRRKASGYVWPYEGEKDWLERCVLQGCVCVLQMLDKASSNPIPRRTKRPLLNKLLFLLRRGDSRLSEPIASHRIPLHILSNDGKKKREEGRKTRFSQKRKQENWVPREWVFEK